MKKTIVGVALLLAACGTTTACGSSGTASVTPGSTTSAANYNDPEYLAADMEIELGKRENDPGLQVVCIAAGNHQFACHGTFSNGDEDSVIVTVSEDGQTWIS